MRNGRRSGNPPSPIPPPPPVRTESRAPAGSSRAPDEDSAGQTAGRSCRGQRRKVATIGARGCLPAETRPLNARTGPYEEHGGAARPAEGRHSVCERKKLGGPRVAGAGRGATYRAHAHLAGSSAATGPGAPSRRWRSCGRGLVRWARRRMTGRRRPRGRPGPRSTGCASGSASFRAWLITRWSRRGTGPGAPHCMWPLDFRQRTLRRTEVLRPCAVSRPLRGFAYEADQAPRRAAPRAATTRQTTPTRSRRPPPRTHSPLRP